MEYTIQVKYAVYSNIPTVISFLLQALEERLWTVTSNMVVENFCFNFWEVPGIIFS
jgi:hypothetical protein